MNLYKWQLQVNKYMAKCYLRITFLPITTDKVVVQNEKRAKHAILRRV